MKFSILLFILFFPLHTHADTISEIQSTIATQQAQIQRMDWLLETLEAKIQNHEKYIEELKDKISQLEASISENVFSEKIVLSSDKKSIIFQGVNVQIVNGTGNTNSKNGLGNLIIGYNEDIPRNSNYPFCESGSYSDKINCTTHGFEWGLRPIRTGSHNIVIGFSNSYTNVGGIVAGSFNVVSGPYSSVAGGKLNIAAGDYSSVTGGNRNRASGKSSSISGGALNVASGSSSSILGGVLNSAIKENSHISGGIRVTY